MRLTKTKPSISAQTSHSTCQAWWCRADDTGLFCSLFVYFEKKSWYTSVIDDKQETLLFLLKGWGTNTRTDALFKILLGKGDIFDCFFVAFLNSCSAESKNKTL